MKKILTLFSLIAAMTGVYAQSPYSSPYQMFVSEHDTAAQKAMESKNIYLISDTSFLLEHIRYSRIDYLAVSFSSNDTVKNITDLSPNKIIKWGVDPLAAKAPDWSPFRVFFNNPIIYTDPDGRFETDFLNEKTGEVQHVEDGSDQVVIVKEEQFKRIQDLSSPTNTSWNQQESEEYFKIIENGQTLDWDSEMGKIARIIYAEMSMIKKTTAIDRNIVAASVMTRLQDDRDSKNPKGIDYVLRPSQYNAASKDIYKNNPYWTINNIKNNQPYFYKANANDIIRIFGESVSSAFKAYNGVLGSEYTGVVGYVSPPLKSTHFDNVTQWKNATNQFSGLKGVSGVWKKK